MPAPAAPTSLQEVDRTPTTVTISFTDNSGGTAYHRLKYRLTTEDPWVIAEELDPGLALGMAAALDPGTPYLFTASAFDGVTGEESPNATAIEVATLANQGTGVIPGGGGLEGVGEAPSIPVTEGTGAIPGTGNLAGVGETPPIGPKDGMGVIAGGGGLEGLGSTTREGVGSFGGAGNLVGVGFAPITGDTEGVGSIGGAGGFVGVGERPPDPGEGPVSGVLPAFATAWAWVQEPADLHRKALALSNGGVGAVDDQDPREMGGRRIVIPAGNNRWVELPLDADPGSVWTMGFWWATTTGSGGFGGQVVFGPTNGSGDLGVNVRAAVPTQSPQTRRATIRIGAVEVFQFPNGSAGGVMVPYIIEVVQDPSAGRIRAWRDGQLMADLTGMNTARAFQFDRLRLGSASQVINGSIFAHPWILPTVVPSREVLAGWLRPASDVAPNEFTRSDDELAHYEHLRDLPHDGEGTMLSSDPEGQGNRTCHGFDPLPAGRTVIALRGVAVSRGDDLELRLHSGSAEPVADALTDYDEEGFTAREGRWLDEDPDTDLPWEPGGVGAVEVEVEHDGGEA